MSSPCHPSRSRKRWRLYNPRLPAAETTVSILAPSADPARMRTWADVTLLVGGSKQGELVVARSPQRQVVHAARGNRTPVRSKVRLALGQIARDGRLDEVVAQHEIAADPVRLLAAGKLLRVGLADLESLGEGGRGAHEEKGWQQDQHRGGKTSVRDGPEQGLPEVECVHGRPRNRVDERGAVDGRKRPAQWQAEIHPKESRQLADPDPLPPDGGGTPWRFHPIGSYSPVMSRS